MEQEKHFESIRFNENYRYEDYPGGWDPAARLKDQDEDGVEAEVLFASPARFFYAITDEPYQRATFHSYNDWLYDFCQSQPETAHRFGATVHYRAAAYRGGHSSLREIGIQGRANSTRIKDRAFMSPSMSPSGLP